ncbi:MAG TPA: HPF/RaiA family ribosome-associated protein [Ferruginibacter sp.]|nr:HPF/RaiA family ribosome-associated protein [Ferruginibacter sp.]
MIIQFNTDNNLSVHEGFSKKLQDMLNSELKRFNEIITRLEVHFADENGHKKGVEDKRCLLEARIKNKNPIAVTAYASNYEIAAKDAAEKLKKSLNAVLQKMQAH